MISGKPRRGRLTNVERKKVSGGNQSDGGEVGLIAGDIPGDDGDTECDGVGTDEEIRERRGLSAAALAVDPVGLGGEEECVFREFQIAEIETS